MTVPLLSVCDLHVAFPGGFGRPHVSAVDGVSFSVEPGQAIGLVGESGCGKTVTALAVLGLLHPPRAFVSGSVTLGGLSLRDLPAAEMRRLRGRRAATVFQDPMTALNPILTVGRQIAEVMEQHFGLSRRRSLREAVALLDRVGIPDPERAVRSFPHQMSGGMRQRVSIAMAVAGRPELLIADEPTTGLDVTVQAQILELLRQLVAEAGMALILITHDLGVVAGTCEEIHVMYAGRIVETADRRTLYSRARHPYTAALLASVPRLDRPRERQLRSIAGTPSDVIPWADGCAFVPRCPREVPTCRGGPPPLSADVEGMGMARCVNPVPAGTAPG